MPIKQLIYYEYVHCKLDWKYKSFLKDDYEIIHVSDIQREINYCSNSTQYIMRFIEIMKDRVIRLLPDLHKVKITLSIFDKDNVLHRLIIGTYYIICKMLRRDSKINIVYKTVFTTIEYEGTVVFTGHISFDGIK